MLLKPSWSEQLEVEEEEEGMEAELKLSLGGAGEQKKQMTIFYKDRVYVCYATENQAKAIISMAKSETTEEELKSAIMRQQVLPQAMVNARQSMKRSLQRFLQKRRARLRDASACPYAANLEQK
ncbi:protein TIFY 5A-like [Zingiber officinale]|uniref:Protein TIFY n=1 Tax=Zingiber officinale TaxID=94328 RepID=A0A8J5FX08_ZINOF|nr:protein TIFY 5A-like [Zingiber officinale]KAG6492336.1 hypothetical protein ZIOFF_047293 [Zingiber officinale]